MYQLEKKCILAFSGVNILTTGCGISLLVPIEDDSGNCIPNNNFLRLQIPSWSLEVNLRRWSHQSKWSSMFSQFPKWVLKHSFRLSPLNCWLQLLPLLFGAHIYVLQENWSWHFCRRTKITWCSSCWMTICFVMTVLSDRQFILTGWERRNRFSMQRKYIIVLSVLGIHAPELQMLHFKRIWLPYTFLWQQGGCYHCPIISLIP